MSNSSTFKNFAFISYSHADKKAARELQKVLDDFQLPNALKEKYPDRPVRLREIFRDDTGLPAGSNLTYEIQKQLKQSNYLIVICSPNAVRSHWVNKEIEYFKEKRDVTHIIPFIIDGIANAKQEGEEECFPEALKSIEARGANISTFSFERAVVEVIAGALEIDVDDLWQRHVRAEEEKKKKLQEQNNRLLVAQAKAVSQLAITFSNYGDRYKAERLCLEVLPKSSQAKDRPYVANAEFALRMASQQSSCYQECFSIEALNGIYERVTINWDIHYMSYIKGDEKDDHYIYVINMTNGHIIHKSLLPYSNFTNFYGDHIKNGLYFNDKYILAFHQNGYLHQVDMDDANIQKDIHLEGFEKTSYYSLIKFSQSGRLVVGRVKNRIIGWNSVSGEIQFDYTFNDEQLITDMVVDEECHVVVCLLFGVYMVYDYIEGTASYHSTYGTNLYYDSIHKRIICNNYNDDGSGVDRISVYELWSGEKKKEIDLKGNLCGISENGDDVYINASKGRDYCLKVYSLAENQIICMIRPSHKVEYVLGTKGYLIIGWECGMTIYRYKQQYGGAIYTNKNVSFKLGMSKTGNNAVIHYNKNKLYNHISIPNHLTPYFVGGSSNDNSLCISDSGTWMTQLNVVNSYNNRKIHVHKNLTIKNTSTNRTLTLERLEDHDVYWALRFVGDNYIAAMKSRGILSIWDIVKQENINSIKLVENPYGDTSFIAVSPDNTKLAACIDNKKDEKAIEVSVHIVSLLSGKCYKIATNMEKVEYAVFSMDNKQLALLNSNAVIVLHIPTKKVKLKFGCNKASMASFSKNGKYLMIQFVDTIEVVHIALGEIVFIENMPEMINYSSFCLDGKFISIVMVNGEVKIIEFPPFEELVRNKRLQYKGLQFSKEEKEKYFLTD